jgi:hypothetical protein
MPACILRKHARETPHGSNIVVVASSARLCAFGIRRYSSVGDLGEPSLGAEVHSESNLLYSDGERASFGVAFVRCQLLSAQRE